MLDARGLCRDGIPIVLGPRALTLVRLLADPVGRGWARRDLLDRIWPVTPVADPALSQLVSEVRRATAGDLPGLQTLRGYGYRLARHASVPPGALPGRNEVIATLAGSLAPGAPALVHGPDGAGTTSVARQIFETWPGPTWWIDVGDVSSEGEIRTRLARGLDRGGSPDDESLHDALRLCHGALVVFDGITDPHHPAVGWLRRFLPRAPVACLTTAQHPFLLPRGALIPLRGLDSDTARQLLQAEGGPPRDASSLAPLVDALDGQPLALCLARRVLRTRSPTDLMTRIGDGGPAAMLRIALGDLDPTTRGAIARLAAAPLILPRGAAEALAEIPLVSEAWLAPRPTASGTVALHAAVRAAAAALPGCHDPPATPNRLVQWALDVAEPLALGAEGVADPEAWGWLAQHRTLFATLSRQIPSTPTRSRLARLAELRPPVDRIRLRRSAPAAGTHPDPARARPIAAAQLRHAEGLGAADRRDEGRTWAEVALSSARALGDRDLEGWAHDVLMVLVVLPTEAAAHSRTAGQIPLSARSLPRLRAAVRHAEALLQVTHVRAAEAMLRDILAAWGDMPDDIGFALRIARPLAIALTHQGRLGEAVEVALDARARARRRGLGVFATRLGTALALIWRLADDADRSRGTAQGVLEDPDTIPADRIVAHTVIGDLAWRRGDLAAAADAYRRGGDAADGSHLVPRTRSAMVAASQGDHRSAVAYLRAATGLVEPTPASQVHLLLAEGFVAAEQARIAPGGDATAAVRRIVAQLAAPTPPGPWWPEGGPPLADRDVASRGLLVRLRAQLADLA